MDIFKIRNTDLQFRSLENVCQKNEKKKKKKDRGNCKALCVSCKRSKSACKAGNLYDNQD